MFVRKMLARALPLTALGLAAWCPAYAVEEPVKADDVYVTATRVEKELQDVPMSVSVMTSEDIKRSPARTIGELLQDVPGVEIRNSGGQGFKRISIRGENPNRVLILIDGQKLVENKSMDGTPLLIDPSNVERVEVIKGPASVLYGSDLGTQLLGVLLGPRVRALRFGSHRRRGQHHHQERRGQTDSGRGVRGL